MLVRTSKRISNTEDIEWLLKEAGINGVDDVQGLTVSEFVEKYSRSHFCNSCLDRLLELGVVYVPEGEVRVNDLPITTRLRNILLRNNVYVLSDIKKYAREDILKFRNLGAGTMKELEAICEKEGIHIPTLKEIEARMLGVKFSDRQLSRMFDLKILYPEDFLRLTEEDVEYLIHLDKGMRKKIEKMQKLCEKISF